MPFDIQGAKKEGYTDTEIADYLASQRKFDVTGARKEGYGDTDIIAHLAPERPFLHKAVDWLSMGHAYPEPTYSGSELTPEGKLDPRVKTGDPGFFQDPITALTMGGVAGARAAVNPLRAAAREAVGWFTGGGSEVPALTKAGAKGIARVAEIPNLAKIAEKRAGVPFAEVPVRATITEPASKVAAEAAPRIAPKEIVQPGATVRSEIIDKIETDARELLKKDEFSAIPIKEYNLTPIEQQELVKRGMTFDADRMGNPLVRISRVKREQEFRDAVKAKQKAKKEGQPGATSGGKQPWEMTREEYVNVGMYPGIPEGHQSKIAIRVNDEQLHKGWVQQALSEGKPVPPSVLKDYPELGAKVVTKTAARTSEKAALGELEDFFNSVSKKPQFSEVTRDLPGLSARETFSLANPETEWGKLQPLDRGPGTVSMNALIPEVKGGATGELPKYAEGSAINLERLNTTQDVKQFINERAKALEKTIGKRTVSWDETRAQAEALGWDEKAIRKAWNRKGSFTAAEIDATRQTNLNAITDLQEAIRNLPADQTKLPPELRAKVLDMMGLIKVTSQAASEAGRALNIHKRVLSNDPAFRATSEFNRVLNIIAGKGGSRTDDLINKLRDIDFSDTAAVNRFIYDATKRPWEKMSDAAYELWMNGLLSNPLTHIVNTTSNALTLAYTYPERLLATGIEAARAKITGTPRGMFFGETAQDVFSISKGLQDAVKRFGTAMKKGDLASKLDYRPTALPEGLSKVLPGHTLIAEDAFFKGFIENAELNRLAYRQASKEGLKGEAFKSKIVDLLANPTEDMLESVAKRGKYLTYQQELGATGNLIFRARETVPGLKYFIPFVKTPTNIVKFAIERSPLYLPVAISKAIKGELKGAQLSEQLAKPLMGTMLGATVYQLAEQGYITGGMPKTAAERNEKLATGWQPYSVKWGDTYYSFGRLEPLGAIMGMAASMSDIKTQMDEKEKFNIAAAIMGSITENLSNKTFMQGLTNLIQGVSDPGRYGTNIVKQLAGSVVPAVSGGVARAIDPNVRDTRSIADTLQSRIPVAAESLPKKLTVWGEPIERPGSSVGRLISPMQVSKEKGSPIEKELLRLDLDIGYPSRKMGSVELQPEEYWQMVQQGSKPAKTVLDALAKSSAWKAKSDYQKEADIKSIVNRYRGLAQKQMVTKLVKDGRLKPSNEKELMYLVNQFR